MDGFFMTYDRMYKIMLESNVDLLKEYKEKFDNCITHEEKCELCKKMELVSGVIQEVTKQYLESYTKGELEKFIMLNK
jgi:hypothetical protein